MSYPLSPLAALAKAYPGLTSAKRLQAYTRSRLPPELRSRGDLTPIGGGTGRIPFALGDELIVKTARMPRGMMENTMEGDWVAPVPEAVWKSDDDAVAVVKRALPADAKLKRDVKKLQPYLFKRDPQYDPEFQQLLEDVGFGEILNYDPLWGDIAPRNVGLAPSTERVPLLLDAGILNRSIMEPSAVREAVTPADWASYRRDVLRAKKDGGPVKFAGGGLAKISANLLRQFRGLPYATLWEPGRVENIRTGLSRLAPSPSPRSNVGPYAWSSSNPLVAESYAGRQGVVLPLELEQADVVLPAEGKFWNEYFYGKTGKGVPRQSAKVANKEFAEAMRDPAVRSILVRDIVDPGGRGLYDVMERLGLDDMSDEALRNMFVGDNLLIKDPRAVRYRYTKEPGNFAQGGLAQCACDRR